VLGIRLLLRRAQIPMQSEKIEISPSSCNRPIKRRAAKAPISTV
jgi:hypothetical protein